MADIKAHLALRESPLKGIGEWASFSLDEEVYTTARSKQINYLIEYVPREYR